MFLKFFKHDSYCLLCLSTTENNSQCVPVHKSLCLTVSNCRKQLLVTVKDNNVCAGHTLSRQGDK